MKIVEPSVTLLWVTSNPEKKIEGAGRTCYKSEDRISEYSASGFAARMVKSGHHAMLEHAVASFRIVTDRGISHEIVRHRIASYAQESTRYCNYSGDKFGTECSFIKPPGMDEWQEAAWMHACISAELAYLDMVGLGCTPQIARSVLPTCLKTELVMTANFREWRHFIKLRGSLDAHPQIRPIAYAILRKLRPHAPGVFADIDFNDKEGDHETV